MPFVHSRCSSYAAALLAAMAAPCLAAGPDITYGEVTDTIRYGPVGSIYAYAWGTGTCNIGGTSLSWINRGTPAVAMSAYRLHNGRLMQIGIGHCKHACCVANGPGCGTCSSQGFGLRPGCRDVYGAGFNGGQGALGPRSGINAYDRTFNAIPTGSGDAIWRRVQVQQADMASTLTGAMYFAEGVYVCLEEDPSDALNNASYRRCTVANTGTNPTYNWTVADATRATFPAIYAWRDYGRGVNTPDPTVAITAVDLPNEGRFIAAGKVSNRGDGTWQYEYAVFNLNSHRSGASFSIPIQTGATATNLGFHAPPYHSGEPYSNAPWTMTANTAEITWASPQTFQQNQNTNALRWGTMYNFWFTSPVAPAPNTGSATLGLFRPGTPSAVAINGLPVPCRSPLIAGQPASQMTVCQCATVEMPVTLGSNPSAGSSTFVWQKETAPGQWTDLVNGPRDGCQGSSIVGQGAATLRIVGATPADSGVYRCVVTNACGSTNTAPTLLAVCIGDFNCDGGTDGADVVNFFDAWEAAEPNADTNLDGGIDGNDVEMFFTRWQGGC